MEAALIGVVLSLFAFAQINGEAAGSTLQTLGVFAYVGLRIQPSLKRIISGLNNIRFTSAPVNDVAADLDRIARARIDTDEVDPIPFAGSWRAEGVSYRYPGTRGFALQDVDLTITPGELIGVCGPTGGGKTTLVDVLTGLLEPTEGRVTVDGHDLRQHARGWHRNLGVVPQMVFLMDDSLRRNIALGVPDHEVDQGAVGDAVEQAQLKGFVDSLPDGLDTVVGERGVRVSGGQRQRIAIARALYTRPRVIVFDEGTSALDTNTEAELMAALQRLRSDHTIMLVAHRLSTVRTCDRIVVMEEGRVVGLADFEELRSSNVAFQRLVVSGD
jgi:ATP-binding cassette subfamily C protein